MTTEFDPSADFIDIADLLEPVTLRRRGNGEEVSVVSALRRHLSEREAARSNGKYLASDVRWHLPADQLSSAPRLGDRIVETTGDDYTIVQVSQQVAASRYQVVCRNLAVVHSLCERIDIQEAVVTQGTLGEEVLEWVDHLPGIRARIQPLVRDIHEGEDRRTLRSTHTIFVAEPLDLTARHRVVGPEGKIYRVIHMHREEEIGALAEIRAFADGQPNSNS